MEKLEESRYTSNISSGEETMTRSHRATRPPARYTKNQSEFILGNNNLNVGISNQLTSRKKHLGIPARPSHQISASPTPTGILSPTESAYILPDLSPSSRTVATTIPPSSLSSPSPPPPRSQKPADTLLPIMVCETSATQNTEDLLIITSPTELAEIKSDLKKALELMVNLQQEMKWIRHRQDKVLEAFASRTTDASTTLDETMVFRTCATIGEYHSIMKKVEEDESVMNELVSTNSCTLQTVLSYRIHKSMRVSFHGD